MNAGAILGLAIVASIVLAIIGLVLFGVIEMPVEDLLENKLDMPPPHPREAGANAALADWQHGTKTPNPEEAGGLNAFQWQQGYDDFHTSLVQHTALMPAPF